MSIIEDAKSVAKLIQQIDNVELYRKILDLQGEIMELVDENRKLKIENDSLKEAAKTKASLRFDRNAYWQDNVGPFCSRCWDKENKLMRMLTDGPGYHKCPDCKESVETSGGHSTPAVVDSKFDPRDY